MSEPAKGICDWSDHELRNAPLSDSNPVYDDQSVTFLIFCNKCGKKFHDVYVAEHIADADTDEIMYSY